MSRYIDADIAKNLILNDMAKAEQEGKDLNGYTDALFHLKTIPTADVVEVVRCKECKYFTIDDGDSLGYCTCQKIPMNFVGELYPEEDFYCRYGERKEDE